MQKRAKIIYNRPTIVTAAPFAKFDRTLDACASDIAALHARCSALAPNYNVSLEDFASSIRHATRKYLGDDLDSPDQLRTFLAELQIDDLHLALACALGNEHAWWDFDAGYRRFIERIARHLASAETAAEEVTDYVYTELYGTRVVEGVRQSKFSTYTGRGTLHGWLRAIVWHAVVDLHRASHPEVPIEDWSAAGGETEDRPGWRAEARGGEEMMIDHIARERYGEATRHALAESFAALDDHEKLLLMFYHVEGLKLREIARFVEQPASPLRRWFQRQSKRRHDAPDARVHESTVMRWLEKVYAKVQTSFRAELKETHNLSGEEIEICIELAGGSLTALHDARPHLTTAPGES